MSDLKFGTSGLRGLVVDLQGQATRRYVRAFLRHLDQEGLGGQGKVFLGRDFRASSPDILMDCAIAVAAAGLRPVDCGAVPTPALALHAMAAGCPAIMVTGSHIPEDRNGLKFYLPADEISKKDELGILAVLESAPVAAVALDLADEHDLAMLRYRQRFQHLLPASALKGLRVGVYQHSTVARDVLVDILEAAGADVVPLGRKDDFIAVDTEAFADAVFAPLAGWVTEYGLDAIVSADGDGDRPLVMDGQGQFVRGDVLGLLAARFLDAKVVVTPVTSNSAIERTGFFETVRRTRVGSPYVAAELGGTSTIGFEANGGTFVGNGLTLAPLRTRDAVLPILCLLGLVARENVSVSDLVAALPLQHALADRLQNVPSARSQAFLTQLADDPAYAETIFGPYGIAGLSQIDGMQFRTREGDMVHFRASGNAPEIRCYVEGSSAPKARELLEWGMGILSRELAQ